MWARLLTVLRVLFRRRELERQLDEELRFHLEMQELENRRRGMHGSDARVAASNIFGGYERVKEQCRDARGGRALETLGQDVRFAVRTLRANPGWSIAAILTLGLGSGANTAMFSVVNGVLIQPLPYMHEDRLVHLVQRATLTHEEIGFSPQEFHDYQSQNSSFDRMVEYHSMPFNLLGGSEPQRVKTAVVSAGFFDVMGLAPLLGRTFHPHEDEHGAAPVLVLSHSFWQRAFDGEPTVVGRHVEMNDRLHTIIGVLPPAPLAYPNPDDVYMPVSSCPFRSAAAWRDHRSARGLSIFGRLRPGVSHDAALADLQEIGSRLKTVYPTAYSGTGAVLESRSLRDDLTRNGARTFRLLLATAVFVLLIACANVSNLMLGALVRRDRELALRNALGAGRARLVRQLLTESTILALAGGLLGLALASLSLDMLITFAERFTPRAHEITIDRTVLAFTFAVSIASGLVFGTLPALQHQDPVIALKDGGDRATSRFAGRRARGLLVVGQLAVSFMLLVAAGLTLRSFSRLENVDAGFEPDNVLTARLDLDWSRYKSDGTILQFTDQLLVAARTLPGVTYAAVAHTFPLNRMDAHRDSFQIRGREQKAGAPMPVAHVRSASADYFAAVGIRLVRGRLYGDEKDARAVAVINQSLARRYWGAADPIGQQVSGNGGRTWTTIIGIVSDVRYEGLDRAPEGEAYVPWTAEPWRDLRLVLRINGDPERAASALGRIVKTIDPAQPVSEIRPLLEFRQEALASARLTALMLAAFAALALGIATTGLAGVVAFSVSQRTREFGVRIALGADPRDVVRMVVHESMLTVVSGLALGTTASLFLTRMLSGLLFQIEPSDPLTFLGVSFVLLAVAAAACFVPARRAMLVEPVVALRTS